MDLINFNLSKRLHLSLKTDLIIIHNVYTITLFFKAN